jgi:hypothetical protein
MVHHFGSHDGSSLFGSGAASDIREATSTILSIRLDVK